MLILSVLSMLRHVLLLIISELCKKAVFGCVEGWGVTGWVKGVKKGTGRGPIS